MRDAELVCAEGEIYTFTPVTDLKIGFVSMIEMNYVQLTVLCYSPNSQTPFLQI